MNKISFNDRKTICLWASPRSLSTGLMYSFAQRKDTLVFDEPLFAHYAVHTGVELGKGTHEAVHQMEKDGEKIVQEIILGDHEQPVVFIKSLANQLVGVDRSFLKKVHNVFLVRNPIEIIHAYSKFLDKPTLTHIGTKAVYDLYQELSQQDITSSILVYKNLLLNPEKELRKLCLDLGIVFDPNMLGWEAGPKPEDGAWGDVWYQSLHQSTGFKPYEPKNIQLPTHLQELAEQSNQYYQLLLENVIPKTIV